MVLVAPRNGDYVTLEELISAVQVSAAKESYAVVKGRSKSIKGGDGVGGWKLRGSCWQRL